MFPTVGMYEKEFIIKKVIAFLIVFIISGYCEKSMEKM